LSITQYEIENDRQIELKFKITVKLSLSSLFYFITTFGITMKAVKAYQPQKADAFYAGAVAAKEAE